jgi:precorrin-2 dehydrogenase/sirohydrochlorin ferrochelatase
MIPLGHDFTDETVLIVGGGPVGARKARRFASEALTLVLSRTFVDADFGGAELVRTALDPEGAATWVERAKPALVVAATDDSALNDAFSRAARDVGALLNRADESGDRPADSVVVPATVRDAPVTVAVTTDGRSPALSRYLRQQIEADIEGAGAMAELTATLRTELKADGLAPGVRREAVRAVVRSDPVWKALRTGDANPRREAAAVVQEVVEDR